MSSVEDANASRDEDMVVGGVQGWMRSCDRRAVTRQDMGQISVIETLTSWFAYE